MWGESPEVSAEMRTSRYSAYEKGQEIGVDVFSVGDVVDAIGTSKGKGFAGVMKRHNFKGVGASHGQKRNHRKGDPLVHRALPLACFAALGCRGVWVLIGLRLRTCAYLP